MAEKRKKRGKKVLPKTMERPKILDELPKPDQWDKNLSTSEKDQNKKREKEEEEQLAKSKAAALIALQKKSVEVLTHVRTRVESLPGSDIVQAINNGEWISLDNVLGEDLCSEMKQESQNMFLGNKLELDVTSGITSGEYVVGIKGGQEQYADCPRSVEYVVSLTRHLSGMLNKVGNDDDDVSSNETNKSLGCKLDETASISSLRLFDRKARLSSLALLTGESDPVNDGSDLAKKSFSCLVDKAREEVDLRTVTAIYFMTPDAWDVDCGGGITFQDKDGKEILIEAKNDRLVLLSSERTVHRMEPWLGRNGMEGICSCIVTHLVRQRQ